MDSSQPQTAGPSEPAPQNEKSDKESSVSNPNNLTEAEKEQVEELKQRDAEVRAHEQAHLAAAAGLAMGGPNYEYQTGPDGKQYAIGGDVKIDTSPGRTPEETSRKAQQIRAAALAPSDPSAQDLKVAAKASSLEQSVEQKNENSKKEAPQNATYPNGEITSSRQLVAIDYAEYQITETPGSSGPESDQPSGTPDSDISPTTPSFAVESETPLGTSSD